MSVASLVECKGRHAAELGGLPRLPQAWQQEPRFVHYQRPPAVPHLGLAHGVLRGSALSSSKMGFNWTGRHAL